MKLLWDAIGTEFGGRHELYEMNYAGNHEDIRIQAMWNARTSGTLDGMIALAEQCLADYDENGIPMTSLIRGWRASSVRRNKRNELDRPTAR
jgi:4-hydroxyphenylacetate 3-monooxygenase